jgi:RNA polymerase sigma-70 factor (ECF subfamily)
LAVAGAAFSAAGFWDPAVRALPHEEAVVTDRHDASLDDRLMERGAQGDEEAFRLLVARWERPLFAFHARMLGSREEAQDLGQETFIRVFRQARRYRATGRFRSWLFRIAGNLARSRLRRRRIVAWVPFDAFRHDRAADAPDAEASAILDERRRAVRDALARLPERQRQALVLRRYHDMSHQEIAETMDTTVAAVESLLSRSMTALRIHLAEGGLLE